MLGRLSDETRSKRASYTARYFRCLTLKVHFFESTLCFVLGFGALADDIGSALALALRCAGIGIARESCQRSEIEMSPILYHDAEANTPYCHTVAVDCDQRRGGFTFNCPDADLRKEQRLPDHRRLPTMGVFRRTSAHPDTLRPEVANGHPNDPEKARRKNKSKEAELPRYNEHGQQVNHAGHVVTRGVAPDGESGRSCVTTYLGMIPCANLVGFSGQELARKMPKVAGVILETTFGSVVEIILFVVLISLDDGNIGVIRAAILGSILANVLFCLGMCFFVGGIFHPQQTFQEAISEVGSNLMLVAAVGLVIPTIYYNSLAGGRLTPQQADAEALKISRGAAIVLLVAFFVYIWFQSRSHHGLYEDILEADEERDHDRHKDMAKDKLTFTESVIAVIVALTFVSFSAVFLVREIHFMVDNRGISDAFLGLILIPLVEKVSEHLTAIDEAYDNQMNFALSSTPSSSSSPSSSSAISLETKSPTTSKAPSASSSTSSSPSARGITLIPARKVGSAVPVPPKVARGVPLRVRPFEEGGRWVGEGVLCYHFHDFESRLMGFQHGVGKEFLRWRLPR
ncbi:putative vacuolar cation/proton exchanger 2 [Hortaea werneckii]|nr:putative vacuolar cation/proton exchanger 2 [Hortaea werneckii]